MHPASVLISERIKYLHLHNKLQPQSCNIYEKNAFGSTSENSIVRDQQDSTTHSNDDTAHSLRSEKESSYQIWFPCHLDPQGDTGSDLTAVIPTIIVILDVVVLSMNRFIVIPTVGSR